MKKIVIGVSAGIAAYKSAELVSLLVQNKDEVKVIFTAHANKLIHPNTFAALSQHPVYEDIFDTRTSSMPHIELAKWADILLVAPATASIIAKLAAGFADDLLTTVCLATPAKIILAPAMNKIMWAHPAVQNNIQKIQEYGYTILFPESGLQACGDEGIGRMQEPENIFNAIQAL